MRPRAKSRSEGPGLSCPLLAVGMVLVLAQASPLGAQTCAVGTLNTAACTAPTPITVSTASATALIGSGSPAQITANSITVNLAAATTTGLLAQADSDIIFNGSTY